MNDTKSNVPTELGTSPAKEITDRARDIITVAEAKKRFRESPWSDSDLAKKAGIAKSSVDRYWKDDLSAAGMVWLGITSVLERSLGHVRIQPPKNS